MKKQKLLLIEDTPTLQMIYQANLANAGYVVDVASTGREGLDLFRANNNYVVIMDLFLPDMDGVAVIRKFMHNNPQSKIIVITSNGSVNRAVEAMRAGAFDFLLKPFSDERLLATVASALASFESKAEVNLATGNFYDIIGRGPLMQDMYRKIMRIAPSTAPVFVIGERGVGKEACANAIHNHLGTEARPFISYSGGDLSPAVQDETLFGGLDDLDLELTNDEKGALQKAYGGTLYISEVSELDPFVQSKLAVFLRKVSQNNQYFDNAGNHFPRIICSTSTDPYVLLETRKIREDLFYQLHILTINVPALRDIGDDIIFVAEEMLKRLSKSEQKTYVGLSTEVADLFLSHSWPRNINQLRNLIHKIVASYDASLVDIDMLPIGFASDSKRAIDIGMDLDDERFTVKRNTIAIQQLVGLQLDEVEREFIDATIHAHGGSIPKAAEILGLAPSTIYRKRSKS